ncbi:MAG: hypothetical protein V4450_14650 [Bacteroidota bacterium]
MHTASFSNIEKRLLCALLFVVFSIVGYTQQTQINGLLQTKTGKPVVQVSVLVKNATGHIVAYGFSREDGAYSILLSDTLHRNELFIEVNWLGYKKQVLALGEGKNNYLIILEESIIELKEVKVKSGSVIKYKSDTLSYDVSSFSRREDRSIGDVINHMPGMSVGENGQISFNGKVIANLYIHGDDLMDGRYGLATKVINKEMIKSVDVMQHFQPIQVLKNKVLTNDVAVNLVLKDENSLHLSGQAMAGGGVPEQYDAAMNGILFNKKFKMLNSVKTNNSGTDYRNDFFQFNQSSFLNSVDNTRPTELLSEGIAGDPDIPKQNYYLNRSGVLNANNLVNTKDSLQLKSNIQVFFDRNTFHYSNRTSYYLPGDTIRYESVQDASRKPFLLNTSLTAMVNKSSYYLNNNLRLNVSGYDNESNLNYNNSKFNQLLSARTYDFSNDLQYTPAVKNRNIINLRWYLNYFILPQQLYTGSGLDSDILNNHLPYAVLNQHTETPSLLSNFSAYYLISGSHAIKQTYEAGILNEWQQLNSILTVTQPDGSITPYKGDDGNKLHWQRNKLYVNTSYSMRKKNWEAALSVPLYWHEIHYYENAYTLNSHTRHFFLNPVANIKLYLNAEDYLTARYSSQNAMGNIGDVYRGLILSNYRSLTANNAGLQEKRNSALALNYNYQRNIIMLFINAGITYNSVTASSILSSVLTDNVQRTLLLPYENDQSSIGINAGISKYLFALHTTVSLNSFWRRSRYDQFINGKALPYANDALSMSVNLSGKFTTDFTLNYNGSGSWYQSKQAKINALDPEPVNRVKRFDQNLSLLYSPASNIFFTVKARQLYSPRPGNPAINYLFLDINIRYKLRKWRTDLEFDLSNTLNIREYTSVNLSSNQYGISSYGIRGRMGIIRATFNL